VTSPLDVASPLDQARAVADTVLYEGYLLYPYRASSAKNQVRWQFGVLGPPAAVAGSSEPAGLRAQCVLDAEPEATLTIYLRFLQLQARRVQALDGTAVRELRAGTASWLSWDEAVPHEIELGPLSLAELTSGCTLPVRVPANEECEQLSDGSEPVGTLLRRRAELLGALSLHATDADTAGLRRLELSLDNRTPGRPADRDAASALSFLSAHLLLVAGHARFVSLVDPPQAARAALAGCRSERCWPVLAAADDDILLVSPIILEDHPRLAEQSRGALFDSTEIDEILTLRVMTMTDAEKAEARATDPHAAAIIDRCDAMTAEDLQQLHGILRDPRALDVPTWSDGSAWNDGSVWNDAGGKPWWDPGVDAAVDPERDAVLIGGVRVSRGSRVRVRPRRRADAQDMFFAGRWATVAAVYADVDGNEHVAVVLSDDPRADPSDWYGRYLYFAPDELEPEARAAKTIEEV